MKQAFIQRARDVLQLHFAQFRFKIDAASKVNLVHVGGKFVWHLNGVKKSEHA